MTIIIGCMLLKTAIVIADSRVTYPPPSGPSHADYLQKLYQIGDRLVLGFSGPLEGAYEVMESIRTNLSQFNKHSVAALDVICWIRHQYKGIKPCDREDLSFLIADIEPGGEQFAEQQGAGGTKSCKPGWVPSVPKMNLITLSPLETDPTSLAITRANFADMIGVRGKETKKDIKALLMKHFGGLTTDFLNHLPMLFLHLNYELMSRGILTVGGLPQCAAITDQEIFWFGYAGVDVILEAKEGRFVQRSLSTGKEVPLMTIWEWAQYRPASGTFGIFEDPFLRSALDSMRQKPDD